MKIKRSLPAVGTAIILILSLTLAACTTDQVTATLEAVVNGLVAADSIARPQDAPYLALVTSCTTSATSILGNASLTPLQQFTETTAACAAAAATAPASGAPQRVVTITSALQAFLNSITPALATKSSLPVSGVRAFMATKGAGTRKIDQKKLAEIRKKLDRLKAKHKS